MSLVRAAASWERGDDGGGGRAECCVDYLRRGLGKMIKWVEGIDSIDF